MHYGYQTDVTVNMSEIEWDPVIIIKYRSDFYSEDIMIITLCVCLVHAYLMAEPASCDAFHAIMKD